MIGGVDGSLRRVVAREVTRVDVEGLDDAGRGEAHDARVVAGRAPAAALPAVHPLAVLVEGAGPGHGLGALEHALLRGEEVVARPERLRAERSVGEVDEACNQIRAHLRLLAVCVRALTPELLRLRGLRRSYDHRTH